MCTTKVKQICILIFGCFSTGSTTVGSWSSEENSCWLLICCCLTTHWLYLLLWCCSEHPRGTLYCAIICWRDITWFSNSFRIWEGRLLGWLPASVLSLQEWIAFMKVQTEQWDRVRKFENDRKISMPMDSLKFLVHWDKDYILPPGNELSCHHSTAHVKVNHTCKYHS